MDPTWLTCLGLATLLWGNQAGVRLPPDPATLTKLIVVARVEGWEQYAPPGYASVRRVRLQVLETLKGSPPPRHITAFWQPQLPPGCDTRVCDTTGWQAPPEPAVGDQVIVCVNPLSAGHYFVWQEFTFPFSKEKRSELLKAIRRRRSTAPKEGAP